MQVEINKYWSTLLDRFSIFQKDVYYTEEYVRLNCHPEQDALCFIAIEDDKIFLFPFIRSSIRYNNNTYYDFETAYGYGGGIANTIDEVFIKEAYAHMFQLLKEKNYICGFVRFHPLLQNYRYAPTSIFDRHTVCVDLSMSEDEIWLTQIATSNRSDIRRAERRGLIFEVDFSGKYLHNFVELYNTTMQRLQADKFYYFGDEYYRNWIDSIENHFIGVVRNESKIISAALFMHNGYYGHYHLSGSDRSYSNLCPNNVLLWRAALELKRQGVKFFHLGGGQDSDPLNSLFAFKKKFSHLLNDFHIGKFIFNLSVYEDICHKWELENPQKKKLYKNFLLKYKY